MLPIPEFPVAKVTELAPGKAKVVSAGGRQMALFNVGGRFYATANICLHRQGPLGEGDLDGPVVTCPLHGWTYDVATGVNRENPRLKVATFPTKVEGDQVSIVL